MDIGRQRLRNQHIAAPGFTDPSDVVSWLGAVQAQDYAGGLWAVGLRTRSATQLDVERALADRRILRTWPMRGTLHFVPAADARWMLDLLAPRVIARSAPRLRELELDTAVLARSRKLVVKALEGDRQVTRSGLYAVLEAAGIATADGRGLHVLMRLALEGSICFAAHEGKQPAFALLAEWAPQSRRLAADEALAELARRYFRSHGPATWRDFAWWSGLPASGARQAVELAGDDLARERLGDHEFWSAPSSRRPAETAFSAGYLLPPFDEYTVAYKDRTAVLDTRDASYAQFGGMLSPTIVIDARVTGTWKRSAGRDTVKIAPTFFNRCSPEQKRLVFRAAARYGTFLGLAPTVSEAHQVDRVVREQ